MPVSWKLSLTLTVIWLATSKVHALDTDVDSIALSANRHSDLSNSVQLEPWQYPPVDVAWLLNQETMWVHTVDPERYEQDAEVLTPEPAPEDALIENQVQDLFQPLNAVRVSGHSSTPPELPDDAEMGSLEHPDDLSASYHEDGVPAYYMTLGYGVRRAPRNTHCFYAHPLYFEDPNLERCGLSNGGTTTACSVVHFASRVALSPILMLRSHPCDCVCMLPDCPTCHKFSCETACRP
jgi:hypothetical protein